MAKKINKKKKRNIKKTKLTKKKPVIILGFIVFSILLVVLLIVFCANNLIMHEEEQVFVNNVIQSQRVTSLNGADFDPIYDIKSDNDLGVRFIDLECNEDCSNVSDVRIGERVLGDNEYEIRHGSVVLVIYKSVLNNLPSGQYNISFEVRSGDEIISVSIGMIIVNSEQTNEESSEQDAQDTNYGIANNSQVNNNSASQKPTGSSGQNSQNTNNSSSTSQKPTGSSGQNNQSANSSSSSSSQNNNNSTSQKTAEPAVQESEKTCSELKNCDFNLNDRYIIETHTYNFYRLPEGVASLCDKNESGDYYLNILPVIETKTFYQIGDFTGIGGGNVPHVVPTRTSYTNDQAKSYASSKGLASFTAGSGCGGMGDMVRDWTWQEIVDKGFALDEAKCKVWGLSCGRW